MLENFLLLLLSQFLPQIPFIVLLLIGLVCSIVFYNRCPRPAILLFIGLAVILLEILIGTPLSAWFFAAKESLGIPMSEVTLYVGIIGYFRMLLSTIGQILMIVAVFSGRKPS